MISLAKAIRTAADLGAKVINVSLASCTNAAAPVNQDPLGAAVYYAAVVKDAVIVAAAGNKNDPMQPDCGQNPAFNPLTPPDPADPNNPRNRDWAVGAHHRQPGMVLRLRAVGGRRDPRRAAHARLDQRPVGRGRGPWVRASWAYPV